MSIFSDIGNAVSSVVNTVEHAVGGIAQDVVGEVGKVAGGAIGGILSNPLELLNPFSVLTGMAGSVLGDVIGQATGSKNPLGNVFSQLGNAVNSSVYSTATSSTGGSVYDKIFAALAKLQKDLEGKADNLSKVDPKDQAAQQKALFELQQVQNEIQQLSTAATNMLKTEHDTEMSTIRNFA